MSAFGRLYGVGIGPGDPDLLTVKATKVIAASPVVAFFAKAGRRGNARAIVDCWLKPSHVELPLYYPMTTETHFDDPPYRDALARFYKESTVAIASHLEAGRDVALLSEGDPMLYGSFMHLFIRLRDNFDVSHSAAGRTQAPTRARRRRGDHENRPEFRARQGGAHRGGHG
jgi:precorrin-2/cobalt-factor-2 C20-methyltransferase